MSVTLKLNTAEFRAALQALPAALAREARVIVEAHAQRAAARIKAAYPVVSGNLAKGIVVENGRGGRAAAVMVVRNKAYHAYIFENGTALRKSPQGWNRGAARPQHVFLPIAIRQRRAMDEALVGLLERHGLTVSRG